MKSKLNIDPSISPEKANKEEVKVELNINEAEFINSNDPSKFLTGANYYKQNRNKPEAIRKAITENGKLANSMTINNKISDDVFVQYLEYILQRTWVGWLPSKDESAYIENIVSNSILWRKSIEKILEINAADRDFFKETYSRWYSPYEFKNKLSENQIIPVDLAIKYDVNIDFNLKPEKYTELWENNVTLVRKYYSENSNEYFDYIVKNFNQNKNQTWQRAKFIGNCASASIPYLQEHNKKFHKEVIEWFLTNNKISNEEKFYFLEEYLKYSTSDYYNNVKNIYDICQATLDSCSEVYLYWKWDNKINSFISWIHYKKETLESIVDLYNKYGEPGRSYENNTVVKKIFKLLSNPASINSNKVNTFIQANYLYHKETLSEDQLNIIVDKFKVNDLIYNENLQQELLNLSRKFTTTDNIYFKKLFNLTEEYCHSKKNWTMQLSADKSDKLDAFFWRIINRAIIVNNDYFTIASAETFELYRKYYLDNLKSNSYIDITDDLKHNLKHNKWLLDNISSFFKYNDAKSESSLDNVPVFQFLNSSENTWKKISDCHLSYLFKDVFLQQDDIHKKAFIENAIWNMTYDQIPDTYDKIKKQRKLLEDKYEFVINNFAQWKEGLKKLIQEWDFWVYYNFISDSRYEWFITDEDIISSLSPDVYSWLYQSSRAYITKRFENKKDKLPFIDFTTWSIKLDILTQVKQQEQINRTNNIEKYNSAKSDIINGVLDLVGRDLPDVKLDKKWKAIEESVLVTYPDVKVVNLPKDIESKIIQFANTEFWVWVEDTQLRTINILKDILSEARSRNAVVNINSKDITTLAFNELSINYTKDSVQKRTSIGIDRALVINQLLYSLKPEKDENVSWSDNTHISAQWVPNKDVIDYNKVIYWEGLIEALNILFEKMTSDKYLNWNISGVWLMFNIFNTIKFNNVSFEKDTTTDEKLSKFISLVTKTERFNKASFFNKDKITEAIDSIKSSADFKFDSTIMTVSNYLGSSSSDLTFPTRTGLLGVWVTLYSELLRRYDNDEISPLSFQSQVKMLNDKNIFKSEFFRDTTINCLKTWNFELWQVDYDNLSINISIIPPLEIITSLLKKTGNSNKSIIPILDAIDLNGLKDLVIENQENVKSIGNIYKEISKSEVIKSSEWNKFLLPLLVKSYVSNVRDEEINDILFNQSKNNEDTTHLIYNAVVEWIKAGTFDISSVPENIQKTDNFKYLAQEILQSSVFYLGKSDNSNNKSSFYVNKQADIFAKNLNDTEVATAFIKSISDEVWYSLSDDKKILLKNNILDTYIDIIIECLKYEELDIEYIKYIDNHCDAINSSLANSSPNERQYMYINPYLIETIRNIAPTVFKKLSKWIASVDNTSNNEVANKLNESWIKITKSSNAIKTEIFNNIINSSTITWFEKLKMAKDYLTEAEIKKLIQSNT